MVVNSQVSKRDWSGVQSSDEKEQKGYSFSSVVHSNFLLLSLAYSPKYSHLSACNQVPLYDGPFLRVSNPVNA